MLLTMIKIPLSDCKTNIANTIKLNRSDDDEGGGHVNSVNSGEKGVDRAG